MMKQIINQLYAFYKHITFSEYTRPILQLVQSAESFLWTDSAQHIKFATLVLSSNQLGPIRYLNTINSYSLCTRIGRHSHCGEARASASLCPQGDLHWARLHILHVAAPEPYD